MESEKEWERDWDIRISSFGTVRLNYASRSQKKKSWFVVRTTKQSL